MSKKKYIKVKESSKEMYVKLVDDIVESLNTNKEEKLFAWGIIKPKVNYTYKDGGKEITTNNYRAFRVYCHDMTTGFRHLIYEDHFIPNKPDTFLSEQYKIVLMRSFIVNAGSVFLNAIFNSIKGNDNTTDTKIETVIENEA